MAGMQTSMYSVVQRLTALQVEGVNVRFDSPPASLNGADLPAMWVQQPAVQEGGSTFGASGGWGQFTARLVIAVRAVGQTEKDLTWQESLEMADRLRDALAGSVRTIARGRLAWLVSVETAQVSGTDYWIVQAQVTVSG
jgi:hypothetical protein